MFCQANTNVTQTRNIISHITTADTVNLATTFFFLPVLVNQTELLSRVFNELQGLTEAAVAENECDSLPMCYCLKRGELICKWRPHSYPATNIQWVTVH